MENKDTEARKRELYEWQKKPNFLDELKECFNKTSKEQILKDWDKTKKFDEGGILIEDFTFSREEYITSTLVKKILELQEGIKSFNRKFNIFGSDITNYSEEYIVNNLIINHQTPSKCLFWKLDKDKTGVFLTEWFNIDFKTIMLKDLNARRLNIDFEIEILEEQKQEINKEIKRYENNCN